MSDEKPDALETPKKSSFSPLLMGTTALMLVASTGLVLSFMPSQETAPLPSEASTIPWQPIPRSSPIYDEKEPPAPAPVVNEKTTAPVPVASVSFPSSSETSLLKDQIKTLEKRVENTERHSIFSMICSLKTLAEQGRRFDKELSFLRRATTPYTLLQEELSALAPAAEHGAISIQRLKETAHSLAPVVASSEEMEKAASWTDRVWAEIKRFVSIRRLNGTPVSGTMDAVMSALAQDDLPQALKEAQALPGPSKVILKDWMRDLESRVAMDKSFARLFDQLEDGLQ